MDMRVLKGIVSATDAGRPLKYYLRGTLGLSSHQLSQAKFAGSIRVNGEISRVDRLLSTGDMIEVVMSEYSDRYAVPEEGNVDLPYQDQDLLVIDKPAPLPCQASDKQPSGTLENRLAWHFLEAERFVFRPVNRLDKGTSGLMAAAMHPHAFRILQNALHTPFFIREYLAVVEGMLNGEGEIDLPIAKSPTASVRRVVDKERGSSSLTRYHALAHGNGRTLVRLRLQTGRTHQIRVHMSAIGHPVTGDFLYGTEIDRLPGRFALHSTYIAFDHPMTGDRIRLTSPLPKELEELLL